MGGQRINQSEKGGPRWTQSYIPNKEVMDFYSPKKTTAIWVPSIPSWEKEFCEKSISLSWKEICEVKKYTLTFPEIEKWDDSAAEETFHLAKRRYFAKINGTPCDIPEVDPNAYIDDVDWSSLDLGDVDWPDSYDSDSENEENSATMGSMQNLHQDMTTSEREMGNKNKSQWKERPFGYGEIYFPEIHKAHTVICKVVDLYTAEPPIINHWKVDLWSKDFKMPMMCAAENKYGVFGWGSEFGHENEIIYYSGWGSEFEHDKVVCHGTVLPLVFNDNQEKKWRKKNQNKKHKDQERDQNYMNANNNCRTGPKKCKRKNLSSRHYQKQ
ncbi:hypothetical protein SUGI_0366250 [Cryptomeria japonica]|nr:hypothetical protein SUGI_0366250 [Cryptomeria japonica]